MMYDSLHRTHIPVKDWCSQSDSEEVIEMFILAEWSHGVVSTQTQAR